MFPRSIEKLPARQFRGHPKETNDQNIWQNRMVKQYSPFCLMKDYITTKLHHVWPSRILLFLVLCFTVEIVYLFGTLSNSFLCKEACDLLQTKLNLLRLQAKLPLVNLGVETSWAWKDLNLTRNEVVHGIFLASCRFDVRAPGRGMWLWRTVLTLKSITFEPSPQHTKVSLSIQ